ncbi:MAG: DUF1835 domain-containing protein [Bacteroidota bacterium]|nr:DUF1835 domain-containing protein [Bacteroidota bacterium]
MIHIVFQQADVAALKKSFELDESLDGQIIEIRDDYAVGPLLNIYTEEGIENRKQWWREVLEGGDYAGKVDSGEVDDQKTISLLIEKLKGNPDEVAWIWLAQNKHDISGYYWLISQLAAFQERIMILYLHNLPFINEKGHIFYPNNIFEIEPREFVKAKKLARTITPAEFEIDPDEWTKLCNENRGVRIIESGKKLAQYDYNYYDAELVKFITHDWLKANKVISHFLHKANQTTGDAYLLWRLKKLIADNKIDAQGEIKNMKDFEVKARSGEV